MSHIQPKVFLDTSSILAGIRSTTGGSRAILKLGEENRIRLFLSQDVLAEIDDNIRKVAPQQLVNVAALIEVSGFEVAEPPDIDTIQMCNRFLRYGDDAVVLAAAIKAQVDYFVTLDRQHLLGNTMIPATLQIAIVSPADFLAWFRTNLSP